MGPDRELDRLVTELNASGVKRPAEASRARRMARHPPNQSGERSLPGRGRAAHHPAERRRLSARGAAARRRRDRERRAPCAAHPCGRPVPASRHRRRIAASKRARPVPHQPAPRARARRGEHSRTPPQSAATGRVWACRKAVEALTKLSHGLVLIGGPTGSGKTTTLAALVDVINRRDAKHIVTIEDPIEYEHAHRQSVVEQVEIGIDAPDFATALRAAVRQSPDVIVVGEMRDPGDHADCAGRWRNRPPGVLNRSHDRRGVDRVARVRRVSAGTAGDHPAGAVDGAGRRHDADAAAEDDWRPGAGRGAADARIRRPSAHPEERAPAPPSGNHHHAPQWDRSRSKNASPAWSGRT